MSRISLHSLGHSLGILVPPIDAAAGVDFDRVNRRTYGGWQARRAYGRASGWLDAGEQAALTLPGAAFARSPVLDIGFGGGRTVPLMRALYPNYVGIDYTSALVDVARARFPGVDLRLMDAREMVFGNAVFDIVAFSFNGIDSVDLDGRHEILSEVYRVLRPGGYFIFSSLNHHSDLDRRARRLMDRPKLTRPAAVAKWLVSLPLSALNQARLNAGREEGADRSARPVPAHFCGLFARFISAAAEVAEIEQFGFALEAIFHRNGQRIAASDMAADSDYLHYVARKPE